MRGALPVSAKSHALCGEQPEQVSATDAGGHQIRRQLEARGNGNGMIHAHTGKQVKSSVRKQAC